MPVCLCQLPGARQRVQAIRVVELRCHRSPTRDYFDRVAKRRDDALACLNPSSRRVSRPLETLRARRGGRRVTGISEVQSRFEVRHEANLTPLIGREEGTELLLIRRWR
jgi:hypothetical protein